MKYIIENDKTLIKDYIRSTLGISARAMIKLKPNGILVNGRHARVIDYMEKGDVLEIIQPKEQVKEYPAENIELDILYEDENFIFVNKAFGVPVYPTGAHTNGSLLSAFAYRYQDIVFRPIYRLDRNTSGVIVLAKNRMSVTTCKLFKTYIAVCEGIAPENGEIKSPIALENGSKIKRVIGAGQEAYTKFTRLAHSQSHSLVKLNIFTGRTHQIRVHMSSIGFPLAGDDLYGGHKDIISRHALHCHQIDVKSEILNINKSFKADIPSDILNSFKDLFKENL